MFIYNDENGDEVLINQYRVEYNPDDDVYSLWLIDNENLEADYREFISYDNLYKYLGQLRFAFLES